jgi:PAS domain S-box-containing protein
LCAVGSLRSCEKITLIFFADSADNGAMVNLATAPARLAVFALFLLSLFLKAGYGAESSKVQTITSAASVRKLPVSVAAQGLPVRISGVVTYASLEILFVQDSTAGIFVFLKHSTVTGDLQAGKSVTVAGITTPGGFCPSIKNARVTVGSFRKMPVPKQPSLDTVLTGSLDGQWGELRGTVRSAAIIRNDLVMTVNNSARSFTVEMADFPSSWLKSLIDDEISVKGVISTRFNDRRQLVGVNMFVPGPPFVAVSRAAAKDPFEVPLASLGAIGQFTADPDSHRVRVRGTVLAVEPGGALYLSDGRDSISVRGETCHGKPGDLLDVVGFPAVRDFRRALEDAVCRGRGRGAALIPKPLELKRAFKNDDQNPAFATRNDMQLVTVQATLVQILYGSRSEMLLLNGDGLVFGATLPIRDARAHSEMEPGSVLRLTGVCLMSYDALAQGNSFQLLLRFPSDVVVLSRPPWWNIRHALWLVGLLIATACAALVWVGMLRKRVEDQTSLIRTRLEKESALENQYRNLFQTNLAAVLSFSDEGEIRDCNPAFARMVARATPAELIGSRLPGTIIDHDSYRQWMSDVRSNGNSLRPELCLTDANGGIVWVYASVSSDSRQGAAGSFQATLIDISAQRRFEQELVKAKEEAETASRLKGEFLANMSHEIRTPMNAVLGMTSLALTVEVSEEVREYLRMAQDAANQLLTLLNDVLDYSKIEAGKLALEKIEFSPREVLKRTARMLALKAHEKGLELIYAVDQDVPSVLVGDSYRLQQLLVNFIGNAIKFTEEGEIVISMSCHPERGTAYRMQCSIRDTGIGIDPSRQAHIFDPFTQADGSTTRNYGGSGLGLSICRQIVSLMDGQVSIESRLGEGSTFTFDCVFEQGKSSDPPTNFGAAAHFRDKRLLILTSNAAATSMLEQLTASWGMRPCSASTVESAKSLFKSALDRNTPFDLLLADRQFDAQDGFEAIADLRHCGETLTPVIMMLSCALIGSDLSRCRKLPAANYVLKPVDAEDLRSAISQLLELPDVKSPRTFCLTCASQNAVASLKILLAEDNAINRKLASVLLARAGHEVVTVENGRDAVSECEKGIFDVVLMDVQMPLMDGFEATACIRNLSDRRKSEIPIIALTAHALPGYREKCLKAGMNGYLTKPIDPAKLLNLLETVIPELPVNS